MVFDIVQKLIGIQWKAHPRFEIAVKEISGIGCRLVNLHDIKIFTFSFFLINFVDSI